MGLLSFWLPGAALEAPRRGNVALPPRRLNFSELDAFAQDMANSINANGYRLYRETAHGPLNLDWEELPGLLPRQLSEVVVDCRHESDAVPRLALNLGDGRSPARLSAASYIEEA